MATTKRQRSHAGQKPRDELVARIGRVEGQSGAQLSPSAHAPDSESTMSEGEYALRGRPRAAMGAPHILQSSRGCVEEEGCIGRGQASRRGRSGREAGLAETMARPNGHILPPLVWRATSGHESSLRRSPHLEAIAIHGTGPRCESPEAEAVVVDGEGA
jgi:hypothetical protein